LNHLSVFKIQLPFGWYAKDKCCDENHAANLLAVVHSYLPANMRFDVDIDEYSIVVTRLQQNISQYLNIV